MRPLPLALITASTRPDRRADAVSTWVQKEVARSHTQLVKLHHVDLAHLQLDHTLDTVDPVLEQAISEAAGFIVVTSEYNHGYPASMKIALDSLKHQWYAKPIGFVSYGGVAGGVRAVEQLRQAVIEVHLVPVRAQVVFPRIKHAMASLAQSADSSDHAMQRDQLADLIAQVHWWAHARELAHEVAPYPAHHPHRRGDAGSSKSR